ncbi:purple acid phosphatase 22 [Perilla frutescens var. hirtella]|nr:purple acid phosphatase 22 [Perilla frutescens var. hirtella]KAH6806108.1 purple acid phosphatase 22 [Perilla frutescens var. frutescens]
MEISSLLPNLLCLFFFLHFASPVLPEYTRPPPRPLILRSHNQSDSHPQQVHISLAGKDYMRVSWITSDKKARSVVEYGTTPGKYGDAATGESTSYHYFFYSSGEIHHVKIGPLKPTTTYYYRCGGGGQEFSFRTPPSTFPVEFAVAGDLGQTEWTESTLAHVGARDYDVFLLPGDLSYADTQQPLWDSFGRLVEPYASTRPWMVTEGNHEIEIFPIIYPQGFKAYNARWVMPYQESKSTSNLYYSFDVAGVHVVMLGSYTDFDSNSDQYKWLQADLASVDRPKTPWIFALIHAPWYNSNSAHTAEGETMRVAIEDILYRARVDLVLAGHVHAYERFTRVYDNKADQCGPVHLTIGDGGNREGLALTFENPSPSISMFREASFGHGRLRVFNATHAHWSWHHNNDADSITADEIWLESLSSSSPCNDDATVTSNSPNDEL